MVNNMEVTATIIASIAGIIVSIMSAAAYIKSSREEAKIKAKAKMDSVRKKLAQQVIGYHCEENLLVDELSHYTNETPKQIKERMRKKAESSADNAERIYPQMTAKEARVYIV